MIKIFILYHRYQRLYRYLIMRELLIIRFEFTGPSFSIVEATFCEENVLVIDELIDELNDVVIDELIDVVIDELIDVSKSSVVLEANVFYV
jgi:hypothetical protein